MTVRNPSSTPETRYADSEGVGIAYQVFGEGPVDLVMIPGFGSHLEMAWDYPRLARFHHQLSSFARVTVLDKRGTGLSDRVSPNDLPGIEQRKDDLKAVMDAAGVEQAAMLATSDGGPLAMLFAATYPDRVQNLILINSYAKRLSSPDHPEGFSPESYDGFIQMVTDNWGEAVGAEILAPSSADDPEFRNWWAASLRASMSPGAAKAMVAMNSAIDVREALPAIQAPTLVIHRSGDQGSPVESGRYIARNIAGARLLELPGDDHFPWLGDSDAVLAAIEEFVTGHRSGAVSNHALASVLFTDIVSSTEKAATLGDREWTALVKTHDGVVEGEVARFGGRQVKQTGDGSLSVFEGPARAVRCWQSMAKRLRDVGLDIRGGLHTSEVEMVNGDVRGLGVHIAARLMDVAEPGDLAVSSVVRDLSVGSGLGFTDLGSHSLKGVPGEWQVYGVDVGG